jgi:hypothetical protein
VRTDVRQLCRKLRPVLGRKVELLWSSYISESDPAGRDEIARTLELLAAKHLNHGFEHDRWPFPPPAEGFARSGDIELGRIDYANREMYPFFLKSGRLREHILICGRSGSGKTNLTFILMKSIMQKGIKLLAIDWKRGYRDMLSVCRDMRVYTIGRDISPFRFNPLIPPPGCEPQVWIKLIVDVIASAYLGGEGVISLLVAGIDHLYSQAGVYDKLNTGWPTVRDLLVWLKTVKLKGRAAMWQASAERILLAMSYGEFASVVNTNDNGQVSSLLEHNVILEMDGLSSNSDKKMFSEALTLYLYRYRLAKGPQKNLTNLIVLEEAHNLLLQKAADARESVLENSIRMIRQYGLGYVFVDQSASMLSKVAFANSYATIALSQKLGSDIRAIASAMNLDEEQKHALNTLPVGTAVVRLADEFCEPFMIKVPKMGIEEGRISDELLIEHMSAFHGDSAQGRAHKGPLSEVPAFPLPDKNKTVNTGIGNTGKESRPIPVQALDNQLPKPQPETGPPLKINTLVPRLNREEVRFLADIVSKPLSATVARYHRLDFSRRRGNAIRQKLEKSNIIKPLRIATRCGQVTLYQLTDSGISVCRSANIIFQNSPRESLEHSFWVHRAAEHLRKQGYETSLEHRVKDNGFIDILAEKGGRKTAVEIETGKSDIDRNLSKIRHADFSEIILVAVRPQAVSACHKAVSRLEPASKIPVRIITWLDIS